MPALTPDQASAVLRTLPMDPPFVEAFLNGMYTTLFLWTMQSLYAHPHKGFRGGVWMAIMFILYTCVTIHMAVEWRIPAQAFQYHGATPDILTALTHPSLTLRIVGSLGDIFALLLADSIMIWRCWAVWGRNWLVVVPAICASITGAVFAFVSLSAQITVASNPTSTQAERLAPLVRFSAPFFACCLAVLLYTTLFIVARIYLVRRNAPAVTHESPEAAPLSYAYAELIIESSLLYAISLMSYVILLETHNPMQIFPQNINVQIAGIAPTLLIYRISLGHARNTEEWRAPFSFLGFSRGSTTKLGATGSNEEIPRLGKNSTSGSHGDAEKDAEKY